MLRELLVVRVLESLADQTDPEVLQAAQGREGCGGRAADLVEVLARRRGERVRDHLARIVQHSEAALQIHIARQLCAVRDAVYLRPAGGTVVWQQGGRWLQPRDGAPSRGERAVGPRRTADSARSGGVLGACVLVHRSPSTRPVM